MFRIYPIRLIIFILLSGLTAQAGAAPTVLVSVPALHSLVSGLMDGIAEPRLLMDNPAASPDSMLSGSQLRMLANADMIVWAGPGLEKGLYDAIENRAPAAKHKQVILSAMVPLLASGQEGSADPAKHRNDARNLEFWADPRLSIIAIRTLAPRLVRLDPDNTERYLDNEIALIKRLRGLEQKMANTAAFLPVDLSDVSPALNPYFLHRMQRPVITARDIQHTEMIATADCHDTAIRKTSGGSSENSIAPQLAPSTSYGADFYLDKMEAKTEFLLNNTCGAAISALKGAPAS